MSSPESGLPLLWSECQGHEKGEYPLRELYGPYGGGLKVHRQKGQETRFGLLFSFAFRVRRPLLDLLPYQELSSALSHLRSLLPLLGDGWTFYTMVFDGSTVLAFLFVWTPKKERGKQKMEI